MHFLGINLSHNKRKDSVANSGRGLVGSHVMGHGSTSGRRSLRRSHSGSSSKNSSPALKLRRSKSTASSPSENEKKTKQQIRSRVDISRGVRQICEKLADDKIMELAIGWAKESEFQSKKDVAFLVKAIKPATKIQSVKIGWRLSRLGRKAVVHDILPILLSKPTLKSLQFIPDTWISEQSLISIVSRNSLVQLDIRATRVTPGRAISEPVIKPVRFRPAIFDSSSSALPLSSSLRGRSSIFSQSDRSHTPGLSDESDDFAECSIESVIPYISQTVKTLALIDCELLHENMGDLCGHLRRRQHTPSPIKSLSLRHNRDLEFPEASDWAALLTLPHLETLNVSLCDLDESDGEKLAEALESIPPTNMSIRQLNIAGNYRMGASMPRIVRAACTRLTRLDCSFCGVQNEDLSSVLDALADDTHATLRALVMKASRVKDVEPLLRCLRNNTTLQSLVLHHPKESSPLPADGVAALGPALERNYQMSDLRLDIERQHEKLKRPSEFWLRLNHCGRRILIQDDICEDIPYDYDGSRYGGTTTTTVLLDQNQRIAKKLDQAPLHWPNVLAEAARLDDKNVLFWLVHHGVHLFGA